VLEKVRKNQGKIDKPSYSERMKTSQTKIEVPQPNQPPKPQYNKKLSTKIEKTLPPVKTVLQMIPADCLGCVKINNFERSLNKLNKFAEGLYPPPMQLKQVILTQIAGLIGNPNMTGLDFSGDLTCFFQAANNAEEPKIFIFAPVSSYQTMIENSTSCSRPDANGISTFAMEDLLIKQVGDFAVFADNVDYSEFSQFDGNANPPLADNLSSEELKKASQKVLWIYGNIARINESYGQMLQQQLEQGVEKLDAIQKQAQVNNPAIQQQTPPRAVMDFYSQIAKIFLTESKYISETIDIKPNVILLENCLAAKEDTQIAKIFTRPETNTANPLLGYLENGSVFNFAFNIQSNLITEGQLESMSLLGIDSNSESYKQLQEVMDKSLQVFGNWAVCSVKIEPAFTPPFVIKYVIEIDEPAQVEEFLDESIDIWKDEEFLASMEQFGTKMNYTITKNTDSYKGVSIDSAKLTFGASDANSPQDMAIKMIYGDGFNYRWGVVDDKYLVCGIGQEPDEIIYELIDQVQAGEGKTIKTETRQALGILPDIRKSDIMGTFNYLRSLEFGLSFAPIKPNPQMETLFNQTASNIVFAGTGENNKLITSTALPKEHLLEVFSAFMMLQQQQMQQNNNQNIQQNTAP
jgi:hypothetical protein